MLLHALDFANVGLGEINFSILKELDLVVVIIRRGHDSEVVVVRTLVGTAKALIDTMFTNPAWTLLMLQRVDLL
jgi:hypothetical protein